MNFWNEKIIGFAEQLSEGWKWFRRESVLVPVVVLYAGVLCLLFVKNADDLFVGFCLGFGIAGVAYRHVYVLKKRKHLKEKDGISHRS